MAEGDKPYRLYRGGRKKGRVPLERATPSRSAPGPTPSAPRRRRRIGRWVAAGLVGILALAVVWSVLGYRSFSQGVGEANARLPGDARGQLAKDGGSPLSEPTTTLVIGTDGGRAPGREDANRSDSLMLVRTDPSTHRIAYLSIPRDLRVEIPRYGTSKINAANQYGGPALTIETVRALTGLPIDHVVVVDFDGFRELIDALGGIDVTVPTPILSNPFDCPYRSRALPGLGGLALREGDAAHGRSPRTRLLAHPHEPARPVRDRRPANRAPAGRRRRGRRRDREPRRRSCACRSWATRSPHRSRPTSRPGSSRQLGWVRFRAGRGSRSAVGSAEIRRR